MSRATSEKGSVGVTVGGTHGTRVQGLVGHVGMDGWIQQTLKPPF